MLGRCEFLHPLCHLSSTVLINTELFQCQRQSHIGEATPLKRALGSPKDLGAHDLGHFCSASSCNVLAVLKDLVFAAADFGSKLECQGDTAVRRVVCRRDLVKEAGKVLAWVHLLAGFRGLVAPRRGEGGGYQVLVAEGDIEDSATPGDHEPSGGCECRHSLRNRF